MAKNSILKIDENTWCIEEMNCMVYGFLLIGSERAAMIDTGFGSCDYLKMCRTITDKPIDVINTHGHLDHISQNSAFDRAYIHPSDMDILKEHSKKEMRTQYLTGMLTEGGVPKRLASFVVKILYGKCCNISYKDNMCPANDGDIIDLGERPLEIIHTPGHTPGSICILDINSRYLFSGDTVCDEGILLNFDHSCSVQEFKNSMLKLKSMTQKWDKIYPAHHLKPIDSSFIDDYIVCADEILEGSTSEEEKTAQLKMHQVKSIKICYTQGKI